jgi:small-conductance mechanosensitive channel
MTIFPFSLISGQGLARQFRFDRRLASKRVLHFLTILGLTSVLAIGLAQLYSPPAWSQLINVPEELVRRPTITISQAGNLDIADIKLDGEVLFQVAAPTPINPGDDSSASPIERRVKAITFLLKDIVQDGFDPDTLAVAPAVLNDQTVIVASDKDWGPRPIVTVTAPDLEIQAQLGVEAVAQEWSAIIQQALIQAQDQRQLAYLKAQIPYVLQRLAMITAGSLIIFGLQKIRGARHRAIKRQQQALATAELEEAEEPLPDRTALALGLERYLPLSQRASLNLLVRPLLWAAQVSIWYVGIASILDRFPQTRAFADWLMRVPLSLIAVPLGMAVVKEATDFIILLVLRARKNALEEAGLGHSRLDLRLQTLAQLLKDLTRILAVLLGILLFFYLLQALYIGLLALAALVFLAKNVLNNYIQTFYILIEDQYLLGDLVSLQSTSGKAIVGTVDKITLRATQLRNLDGELITVPHGNIVEVANRSYQWSKVNLGLDVAYSADLDQATAVIQQVAQEMQQDPSWRDNILEDPTILGVDAFGHNSITIRLVIKTLPGQQMNVGREFRRRLKPAFDQAGISIPFPQRSIWFENALPTQN